MARGERAYNFIDLTGKVFGSWTVIGLGEIQETNKGKKRSMWLCRCVCGTERLVFGGSLTYGSSICCGCIGDEATRNREYPNRLSKGESTFRGIFKHYKYQAARKNRDWELSIEQFRELTQSNCTYCNSPPQSLMRINRNVSEYRYNGVDRADNTKGYTIENSVPCCRRCNISKGIMSHTEYTEHCKRVADFQRSIE